MAAWLAISALGALAYIAVCERSRLRHRVRDLEVSFDALETSFKNRIAALEAAQPHYIPVEAIASDGERFNLNMIVKAEDDCLTMADRPPIYTTPQEDGSRWQVAGLED